MTTWTRRWGETIKSVTLPKDDQGHYTVSAATMDKVMAEAGYQKKIEET